MTLLRKMLSARIRYVADAFNQISELEHSVTKGRFRELLLTELLEPVLPAGISATTGMLMDARGNQSNQQDIIIYASDILPPLLKSGEQSIVPVDAAIQVIEVKSALNRAAVRDCVAKADSVKSLVLQPAGEPYPEPFDRIFTQDFIRPIRVSPIFSVFAFSTDLVVEPRNEWERYRNVVETEDAWSNTNVYLNDICVLGSGYWSLIGTPTANEGEDFPEVLQMLILLTNSLGIWKKFRSSATFGNYFSE